MVLEVHLSKISFPIELTNIIPEMLIVVVEYIAGEPRRGIYLWWDNTLLAFQVLVPGNIYEEKILFDI